MNSRVLCRFGFHGKWKCEKVVKIYDERDDPKISLAIAQKAIMRCSECGILKTVKL